MLKLFVQNSSKIFCMYLHVKVRSSEEDSGKNFDRIHIY